MTASENSYRKETGTKFSLNSPRDTLLERLFRQRKRRNEDSNEMKEYLSKSLYHNHKWSLCEFIKGPIVINNF